MAVKSHGAFKNILLHFLHNAPTNQSSMHCSVAIVNLEESDAFFQQISMGFNAYIRAKNMLATCAEVGCLYVGGGGCAPPTKRAPFP